MSQRALRRALVGTVVSDKMDKTVVVRVERQFQDPTYKKYVRSYTKFMAHDERGECRVGDRVSIVEHRPLSRHKRWKVQARLAAAVGPAKTVLDEGSTA